MGVLESLVWSQLTALPHPTIDKAQCINEYRRRNCTACVDACTEQVIDKGVVVKSWAKCVDCGRCVTACEMRAISMSEQQLGRLLSLREQKGDKLWLGCEASQRQNDFSGLCEMTWESLAYLSFYKHLVLDLEPCLRCERTQCKEHFKKTLQWLHFFLGGKRFAERVTLAKCTITEPKPEEQVSRRGLFSQVAQSSKGGVSALLRQTSLLSAEELKLNGLSVRALLHKQMKQSDARYQWEIPTVKKGCTGCGICVKECPTGALRVDEQKYELVLDTMKCVQCKACVMACPQRKISGIEAVSIADFTPISLIACERIVCRQCSCTMKVKTSNGLCADCFQKRMATLAHR